MYEFITNLNKKEYEEFNLNNNSHFMQSYCWGEIQKEKGFKPYYVGLKYENKVVATALILEKKIFKNIGYMYIPRSFTCDYKNEELINKFIFYLKKFTKENNNIFLRLDPALNIKEYSNIIELLKRNKMKHKGFNLNFENNQPRYTFRLDINKQINDIYKNFHPTTRKILNKENQYNLNIYKGNINDIDDFYITMEETAERENIKPAKKEYYKKFYEILNKNNMSDIYVIKVNIENLKQTYNELINENKKEIERINSQKNKNIEKSKNIISDINNKIDKLNKELDEINKIKDKELVLSSIITCKYKDTVWTVHGGNHNELRWLNANYLLYYEIIKDANEEGYKIVDFFGTTGNPTQDNPIYGIHLFKQRFGGELIEFIGEFDYVNNHLLYFLYNKYLKFKYKK